MKKSEDWSLYFDFSNAYDVVGAPQDASSAEIEIIAEELQSAMRMLGFTEQRRRLLDRSASILLDEQQRERHDERAETRLLASQDPVSRYENSADIGQFASVLFQGRGTRLRDFSLLPRANREASQSMVEEELSVDGEEFFDG